MLKKNLYLFSVFIFFTIFQIFFLKFVKFFPDFMLLFIVFCAIFLGTLETVMMGLLVAIVRNVFSIGMFSVDILLFPFIGLFASAVSKLLYSQNMFVQVGISFLSMVLLIGGHILYLNIFLVNDIKPLNVFVSNIWLILITSFFSPLFFNFLKGIFKVEE